MGDRTYKRRKPSCDMDCENCKLPVEKCFGGTYKTPFVTETAHTMNDGKGYMPGIVKGTGRKKGGRP